MKKFSIKIYSKSFVLKDTINPDTVKSDISFTKQINWWLGELQIVLDLPITDTSYIQWDIVEVYASDNWNLIKIYTGVIQDKQKTATKFEQTTLFVTGLQSLFTKVIYDESGKTGTITGDPKTLIDNTVDYFNTKYSGDITKATNLYWTSVSYDIKYTKCNDLINTLNDLSNNFFRYLNADRELIFKEKYTTALHKFTYKKNLFELEEMEESNELVNTLYLEYNGWTAVYSNATSISTYWLREAYISNTSITNLTSADEFWTKYLADNKDLKRKLRLKINTNYLFTFDTLVNDLIEEVNFYSPQTINDFSILRNIETIEPWETCEIKNLEIDYWILLIKKITYNPDNVVLELEDYDNFIKLIKT